MTLRFCTMIVALSAFAADAASPPLQAPSPRPRPERAAPTGADIAAASDVRGAAAFLVVDLATGATLDQSRQDLPLPPASVAKIVTALYALDSLGPAYRFETRVAATGPVRGEVLKGDLILQGAGDPEADTNVLADLARQVRAAGVRRVEGRFLFDDTLLPKIPRIDPTQPEFVAYNPSLGALNLNFNRVHAEWRRVEGRYRIDVQARAAGLSPATGAVVVRDVAETTSGGVFDYAPTDAREGWRVARRALDGRGARWLPVRRPSVYAAAVFGELAADLGVGLPSPGAGRAPLVAPVIARSQSRSLSVMLSDMLRYSTNLTAEATGVSATGARGGDNATLEGSARTMSAWAAAFAGFPPGDAGLLLANHSGLSGDSRASARRLVEILIAADKKTFTSPDGAAAKLRRMLPERRYDDDGAPAPRRDALLVAKTGTLNFVSALAGYIDIENGRRLAFAILVADPERRRRLADPGVERPTGALTFASRARRLQRALIRNWIDRF